MGSGLLADIDTVVGSGVGFGLLGLNCGEFETKGIGPKMDGIVLAVDKKFGEIGVGPKMEGVRQG